MNKTANSANKNAATEQLEPLAFVESVTDKPRGTPRDQYLLEKERIKQEIGDLEQIRFSLGLSQRRLCQLLLVDPSAWTRWMKTPAGAPPHIYQALKWLTELKQINPDAAAPRNLASRIDIIQSNTQSKLKELENNIAILERTVGMAATLQRTLPNYSVDLEREILELKAKMALLLIKPPHRRKTRRLKANPKLKAKKRKSKKTAQKATKTKNPKFGPKRKANAKVKAKARPKKRSANKRPGRHK